MRKFFILLLIGFSPYLSAQSVFDSFNIRKNDVSAIVEARKQLCQGNINEAIVLYSTLIENEKSLRNGGRSVNGDYVAEYAYVLALSGLYDGALMNIDLARSLHAPTADFFTGQVLKVIGYKELGEGFDAKATVPEWIRGSYMTLNEKYKTQASMDVSEYSASLQRANILSAAGQEIQALIIFESLEKQYPRYYLPFVCESTMWEKFGNLSFAQSSLSHGLSLYPDDGSEKHKNYATHLAGLENQLYRTGESKWNALINKYEPRPMLYIGGSAGKNLFSLNSRIGLYTNNRFTASANIGYTYSGGSSFSIGASCYKTWGFFMAGLGINEMLAKNNNLFTISPMTGLSFLNKDGNSSYDITLSIDFPFAKDAKVGYTLSFGRTFYFDFKGFKK